MKVLIDEGTDEGINRWRNRRRALLREMNLTINNLNKSHVESFRDEEDLIKSYFFILLFPVFKLLLFFILFKIEYHYSQRFDQLNTIK